MSSEAQRNVDSRPQAPRQEVPFPGEPDPFVGPTLRRALGEVHIDFVAKAWLDRVEGWLVVTPDELAFARRDGGDPLRIDLRDVEATRVEARDRLRDFLRAPQLVIDRRGGAPLIFEMVHYDAAAAVIDRSKEIAQR